MRIVVTGADGFIGRNLRVRLAELGHSDVGGVTRATGDAALRAALAGADFVYHLAGVNRPQDEREFETVNSGFTAAVCSVLAATRRRIPIVYASSTQAERDNVYGRSKRAGETAVERYGRETGSPVFVLRLPNVFGKWSRPNYNSAVATFCHNLARGLPIAINDPASPLRLLYIDDAVAAMIRLLAADRGATGRVEPGPTYDTTVGEVVSILQSFVAIRTTNLIPPVGIGLSRALYSTYMSFLPPSAFSYRLERHTDPRGTFVEMLKTGTCGQVSCFTALPGVTRGEHYHHTKAEKFLVVKGSARFRFRHVVSGETHEVAVAGDAPEIVETVPGWAHNITNAGSDELVVLLWSSEIYDPQRPDTIPCRVDL